MACKKEGVPFSGTPEQEAALKKVITELKDTKGALMPIMQQAKPIKAAANPLKIFFPPTLDTKTKAKNVSAKNS